MTGGVVHLRGRARFVTGAADPKQADLVFLQELIDAGKLRTVIGRRYGLDEIAEAHRYADPGHKIGNVAVLIGSDRVSSGRSGAHSSRRAQLTFASVVLKRSSQDLPTRRRWLRPAIFDLRLVRRV